MKEEKTICLRLSADELKAIDEKAAIRGVSRSVYIRDCALNDGNVFDAGEILSHMAGFSNYVNNLVVGQMVDESFKDGLKGRVNDLWQLLS